MSEKPFYYNPFDVLSPHVDAEVHRLRDVSQRHVSQSSTFQEGLLKMIGKLIEMNGLLSKCFVTQDRSQMDRCSRLAKGVHEEEKTLTSYLVSRGVSIEMFEGVVRFPYRLERIGDMLESILHCCRAKVDHGVTFSEIADEEVGQLLLALDELLTNLRDAFLSPDRQLLEEMIDKGNRLNGMLEDFTSAHWERMENGMFPHEASSTYREILDAVTWTNQYLEKMWTSLLAISELTQGPKAVM
jgi:Na+/phosphate symporter